MDKGRIQQKRMMSTFQPHITTTGKERRQSLGKAISQHCNHQEKKAITQLSRIMPLV
jgi:hypothetical protein